MIYGQNESGLKIQNGIIQEDGASLSAAFNEVINDLKTRHKMLQDLNQNTNLDLHILLLEGKGDACTALGVVGGHRLSEFVENEQAIALLPQIVKELLAHGKPELWLQIYPEVGWPMARIESALFHELFLHVRPIVNALSQIQAGSLEPEKVTQLLADQVLFGETAQHADINGWLYALQTAANRAAFLRGNGRQQDAVNLMVYMGQDFMKHWSTDIPANLRNQAAQDCNTIFQRAGFGEIVPFNIHT